MMTTKRVLLILIPVVFVLAIGVLLSYAGPEHRPIIEKDMRIFSPMGGYRLGVVLAPQPEKDGKAGVTVEQVMPDSPAEKAGIREGDVLKSIDGQAISDPGDVQGYLREMDEQKAVQLEIVREGKPLTLSITPEAAHHFAMMSLGGGYLGVDLQELNPDLAEYFHVDPNAGVLVTSVEEDSPADKAGIRPGDVITTVDGKNVHDASGVREVLQDVDDGKEIAIAILRHGSAKNITARVEKKKFELPDMHELQLLQKELPEIQERLNSPEFRKEMEDLQREMQDMKLQMQDLKKQDLEKLHQELKLQMQELKKQDFEKMKKELELQIQELKKQDLEKMKQDLEKQMQQLKKELEQRKSET